MFFRRRDVKVTAVAAAAAIALGGCATNGDEVAAQYCEEVRQLLPELQESGHSLIDLVRPGAEDLSGEVRDAVARIAQHAPPELGEFWNTAKEATEGRAPDLGDTGELARDAVEATEAAVRDCALPSITIPSITVPEVTIG